MPRRCWTATSGVMQTRRHGCRPGGGQSGFPPLCATPTGAPSTQPTTPDDPTLDSPSRPPATGPGTSRCWVREVNRAIGPPFCPLAATGGQRAGTPQRPIPSSRAGLRAGSRPTQPPDGATLEAYPRVAPVALLHTYLRRIAPSPPLRRLPRPLAILGRSPHGRSRGSTVTADDAF